MNALTMTTRKLACALTGVSVLVSAALCLAGDEHAILPPLTRIATIGSTVPGNGDVNPYGMAQIKRTVGRLQAGHILISNFNNAANVQGTGTTIVDVAPDGALSVFAEIDAASLPGSCPGGVGLTTALVELQQGWVIVGSLPTANQGMLSGSGCLIVLDSLGKVVETFYGSLINGPWDMTALDGEHEAILFVTNVLNGILNNPAAIANNTVVRAGTVTRLNLEVSSGARPVLESITVIASGFPQRTDPAALIIGPTGVALRADCDSDDCGDHDRDRDDHALLYVADTLGNRIAVIDHPLGRTTPTGVGRTLSRGGSLNGPLGLVITPGGHLLTVNGQDGFITEIAPDGAQVAKLLLDSSGSPPGNGALFGLTFDPAHGVYFVDDATNTLNLLHH
jgi:hypothetical protein